MASSSSSPKPFKLRGSFFLFLVFLLYTSFPVFTAFAAQPPKEVHLGRRILSSGKEEKNEIQSKSNKSIKIPANSTRGTMEGKNQAKPAKATTSSSTTKTTLLIKTPLKSRTSTSHGSKSTKPSSVSVKKSLDLLKSNTPKNKTTSSNPTHLSSEKKAIKLGTTTGEKLDPLENPKKPQTSSEKKAKDQKVIKERGKTQHPALRYSDTDEDDDFIAEFRNLAHKFHEAILPDLKRISTTSKAYISIANNEITQGIKPLVGNKYASTISSLTSCIFLLLPLLLVSLLFNQIRTCISLQGLLIFIQVYLAIYFLTLSLTHFATGLEPLRFFYVTSTSTYMAMQVFQTLGYVLYLLMQLLNLVVVFSSKENGLGSKFLGLAQMIVGLAVGLHYYTLVFHRAVMGNPPKTNWKIHTAYATCFLVICLSARVERRKKAYLQEDGDDDGKKS